MKRKMEIEKIKEFIEAHANCLAYEYYGQGSFLEDVKCEIINNNSSDVYLIVNGFMQGDIDIPIKWIIYEKNMRPPQKRTFIKLINEDKKMARICEYWYIRKFGTDVEQLVINFLDADNYLKSIELFKKYNL